MSADTIKDMVRVPTFKEVYPAQLQALLLVCTTLEEKQPLNQNANTKDEVDNTDAFMMEFAQLPGLGGKILCAPSAKTLNEEAVDAMRNMDTFAMIPMEVMNSEKVLETVLAIGNFLSSFKLEARATMSPAKDAKGNKLLDYLVSTLQRNAPGLLPLEVMDTLARSSELLLEAIGDEVQVLLESVGNVSDQIKQITRNWLPSRQKRKCLLKMQ